MADDIRLRELTSADIFPICGILRKVGIKEFKGAFINDDVTAKAKKGGNLESVGMSVMFDVGSIIISNLQSCEKEVYAFTASVSGKSVDELRKMRPADYLELVLAILRHPDIQDFFKVAFKSLS